MPFHCYVSCYSFPCSRFRPNKRNCPRDQIDFVEKDKYGASHLYTLVEIKGVRNDASFEKDYIQGKYGAIPFLGNFTNLIAFE